VLFQTEMKDLESKISLVCPPLAPIQLSTKDLLKFTKPLIRPHSPTLTLSFVFSNSPCLHPFIDRVEVHLHAICERVPSISLSHKKPHQHDVNHTRPNIFRRTSCTVCRLWNGNHIPNLPCKPPTNFLCH